MSVCSFCTLDIPTTCQRCPHGHDNQGNALELLEALKSIELSLAAKIPAQMILDENSPIRDAIRIAIAKAESKA